MIEQLKVDLSKAKTYKDLMGKDGAIKKLITRSNDIATTAAEIGSAFPCPYG